MIKTQLESLEDYLDDQIWWQNTYWPVWRFWQKYNLRQLYLEATYFVQHGRRGYSDRDLWNADDHIARIVLGFIDSKRMGLSFGVGEDYNEPFAEMEKRHRKVEDELRWLMEQHLDDDLQNWIDPKYRKRVDRANRLFGKYWMSLWD